MRILSGPSTAQGCVSGQIYITLHMNAAQKRNNKCTKQGWPILSPIRAFFQDLLGSGFKALGFRFRVSGFGFGLMLRGLRGLGLAFKNFGV